MAGIHLEIEARWGKSVVSNNKGRGARSNLGACAHLPLLGGSGGMLPRKILVYRLPEIASGAFLGKYGMYIYTGDLEV